MQTWRSITTPVRSKSSGATEPSSGTLIGQRARFATAHSTREDLGRITRLLDDSQVRLTISGRFPLERVGEAQTQLERGGSQGKLLVSV